MSLRSLYDARGLTSFKLRLWATKARSALSQGLFYTVVALAPLPYGSRDSSTVSLWCILLGLALIFAPLGRLTKPQLYFSFAILFCVGCTGLVLHEQLSSHPWLASAHPIWAIAEQALGRPLPSFASIVRAEPFYALGPSLAAILALWLGSILGTDRHVARRLLWVVALSGALYSLYGIVSEIIEPNILLYRERESFVGYVTGTFVNRNTAAVYFGSCTVIWQLLLMERVRRSLSNKFSIRRWTNVMDLTNRKDIQILCFGSVISLTALFMTGSRAGVVLSLAMLGVAISFFVRMDHKKHRSIFTFLAIGICITATFYVVLGGTLDARFDTHGFMGGGRSATYHSALRMIVDHPWFGSGLGTFAWAFPAYRSGETSLWGVWDLAHSTPLELATDFGIPLTLLIGFAWIAMLAILGCGVFIRYRDQAIPLSAFCVGLIGLLHSMIDFSLQVPGYAIVAMAVVGVGVAQAFPSPDRLAFERP